jgi:hypothetical protein
MAPEDGRRERSAPAHGSTHVSMIRRLRQDEIERGAAV